MAAGTLPIKWTIYHNIKQTKICVHSHNIADASTAYNLWNQVDVNRSVFSLNPQRDHGLTDRMMEETSLPKWQMKIGEIMALIFTNDVLNSWYFGEMCNVKFTEVAVNLRDRISGITNDLAGNYLNVIMTDKASMKSPATHRKCIYDTLKKRGAIKSPTGMQQFSGLKAMSTNWATFYQPVEIAGFKEIFHHPILDYKDCLLGNTFLVPEALVFIFRPRQGELGILSFDYSANRKTEEDYLSSEFIEKRLLDV